LCQFWSTFHHRGTVAGRSNIFVWRMWRNFWRNSRKIAWVCMEIRWKLFLENLSVRLEILRKPKFDPRFRGGHPAERHPGPMRKYRVLFGGRRRWPGRSEEALAALVPCARIARARSGGWYSLAMWQHAGHPLHDHSAGGATAQVASGRRSRAAPTHRRGKIRCTSHRAQPATRATWNARWTVRLHTHSDRV